MNGWYFSFSCILFTLNFFVLELFSIPCLNSNPFNYGIDHMWSTAEVIWGHQMSKKKNLCLSTFETNATYIHCHISMLSLLCMKVSRKLNMWWILSQLTLTRKWTKCERQKDWVRKWGTWKQSFWQFFRMTFLK